MYVYIEFYIALLLYRGTLIGGSLYRGTVVLARGRESKGARDKRPRTAKAWERPWVERRKAKQAPSARAKRGESQERTTKCEGPEGRGSDWTRVRCGGPAGRLDGGGVREARGPRGEGMAESEM